jgi:hypothetical protein
MFGYQKQISSLVVFFSASRLCPPLNRPRAIPGTEYRSSRFYKTGLCVVVIVVVVFVFVVVAVVVVVVW